MKNINIILVLILVALAAGAAFQVMEMRDYKMFNDVPYVNKVLKK